MIRRCLSAAALILAAASAQGQAIRELLPPQPELAPDPARDVAPRELVQTEGPVIAGGGPSFVLGGIVIEGNTAISDARLAPIWADLVGDEITLGTLDEIVARITAAYRAQGYVLSQAVLPAQTVAGGVVDVLVVEGFVDDIALTGGAPNQQRIAAKFFAPVRAQRPLRPQTLERSVLLSRDTLGSVYGSSLETVLEPSLDTFGAANLGVLITPQPYSGYVTADNRGSRLYGALTLGAGVRTYNLLGLNERLDALVAYAPENSSLAFAAFNFDAPIEPLVGTFLDGARIEIGASVSRADPDLEQADAVEGLTALTNEWDVTTTFVMPIVRTRSQNLYGRLGLSFSDSVSETEFAGEVIEETDRLAVVEARATWDLADSAGGINLVDAAIRQGLDIGNVTVSTDGPAAGTPDFTLAQLTVSRLQALGTGQWALYGELTGQLAANVLPSAERFLLGNSTIGRGFAPGNTTGDSGYAGRIELRRYFGPEAFPRAIEAAEVYAFADYGRAFDRSEARDGEQWEELGSVGIGARIDLRPWLSITPEIAQQVEGIPTDTPDPDLETRFYLGATARF